MNGFELGGKLRRLDDKIKISFMSAFDIPEEDLKTTIPTIYEEKPLIIRKPISIGDFVSRVKEKLEQIKGNKTDQKLFSSFKYNTINFKT